MIAVLLEFNLLLIVLNGLIVFTVLIIFIALICCLFSFLRSFLIALVASIVLNMLAVLIVLLVEDVFYLYIDVLLATAKDATVRM